VLASGGQKDMKWVIYSVKKASYFRHVYKDWENLAQFYNGRSIRGSAVSTEHRNSRQQPRVSPRVDDFQVIISNR